MRHPLLLTIVLLPGLDGSGQFFGRSISYFELYGNIRVLSYPNNGPQDYQSLANGLIRKLPVDGPFVIVAESFSGPIGIELASRHIPGLRGLRVVASFAFRPLGMISAPLTKVARLVGSLPLLQAALLHWFLFDGDKNNLVKSLQRHLVKQDRKILIDRGLAALQCDLRRQLDTVTIPIVSLIAKQDRLLVGQKAAWAKFPKVETKLINGPHFLLQDGDQIELEQAIKAFFAVISQSE